MSTAMNARRHWWLERMSSAALVPLSVWWVHAMATAGLSDIAVLAQWLQEIGNALLLVLFITVALYHSKLGLEVIVDDYLNERRWNALAHTLCKLMLLLAWLAALAGFAHFLM